MESERAREGRIRERMAGARCGACVYFAEHARAAGESRDEVAGGQCRRAPPVTTKRVAEVRLNADGSQGQVREQRYGIFPYMDAIDWCGEFVAREGR